MTSFEELLKNRNADPGSSNPFPSPATTTPTITRVSDVGRIHEDIAAMKREILALIEGRLAGIDDRLDKIEKRFPDLESAVKERIPGQLIQIMEQLKELVK